MPTISSFFGIVVRMYFREHPPPHFHVIYGEYQASVDIDTLETTEGYLPKRAHALVKEWGAQHRNELLENFRRASAHLPLNPILPLE